MKTLLLLLSSLMLFGLPSLVAHEDFLDTRVFTNESMAVKEAMKQAAQIESQNHARATDVSRRHCARDNAHYSQFTLGFQNFVINSRWIKTNSGYEKRYRARIWYSQGCSYRQIQ